MVKLIVTVIVLLVSGFAYILCVAAGRADKQIEEYDLDYKKVLEKEKHKDV